MVVSFGRRAGFFGLLLATAGCGSFSQVQSEPEAVISFRALDPRRGARDCDDVDDAVVVCRVRRSFPLSVLQSRAAAGETVWRDGDELTWLTKLSADSVDLSGGVQLPMSRVQGTDYWIVTARIADLDRAVISYVFFPRDGTNPVGRRFQSSRWAGPRAPDPADTASALRGRIVRTELNSRFLEKPRGVSAYLPPERNGEPIRAVVYVGDGGAVGFASVLDTMITTGQLPRIMLVGMDTDLTQYPDGWDGRMLEYLYLPTRDSTRFLAHERFVLEEVVPWAETLGAPSEAASRAVLGFSNSAAFAIEIALRRPDVFGRAIAFSPAGRTPEMLPGTSLEAPAAFYLLGGRLEESFHRKALQWAALFREHGVAHTVREPVAGHDYQVWRSMLPDALEWAFGRRQVQTRWSSGERRASE